MNKAACLLIMSIFTAPTVSARHPLDSIMAKETRTFLASMPEGLQQRQADAVLMAVAGKYETLGEVRNTRNTVPEISVNVKTIEVGPNLCLFRPKHTSNERRLPLLVYLHGGGWTFGSINSCTRFCDALAATGETMVLAVDYRLAPEHPYPYGLQDCAAAFRFATEHAEEWGADTGRISIGGDSSGGNLALATALYLDAKGENMPRSLLLFYPVVKAYDDRSESWQKYGAGYGLDTTLMKAFNKAYLHSGAIHDTDFVSMADAGDDVLAGLPPVLLVAAGKDILCDQGREFSERLDGIGIDIHRIEFPQAVHLFITVPGQETAFKEAVRLAGVYLTGLETGK